MHHVLLLIHLNVMKANELPNDLVEKEPLELFEGTETQNNFDLAFLKKLNFKVIFKILFKIWMTNSTTNFLVIQNTFYAIF